MSNAFGANGRVRLAAALVSSLVIFALLLFFHWRSSGAHAAGPIVVKTTTVDSTNSDGLCSLRKAIDNANAASDTTGGDCAAGTGNDTINFSVSGTLTLGSTLPAIQNILTIDGSGQTVTVDGANLYGIFVVNSGATLDLNNLTIAHGTNLNIPGVVNGIGAIFNTGALAISNCTFSGNSANANSGGGIYNYLGGSLSVSNSTFSGNSAHGDGGAI